MYREASWKVLMRHLGEDKLCVLVDKHYFTFQGWESGSFHELSLISVVNSAFGKLKHLLCFF